MIFHHRPEIKIFQNIWKVRDFEVQIHFDDWILLSIGDYDSINLFIKYYWIWIINYNVGSAGDNNGEQKWIQPILQWSVQACGEDKFI